MEPLYIQNFEITDIAVDRYGRMKPSMILFIAQEIAGRHCLELSVDYDTLAARRMFWAVTRHKVQITRLPQRGETIRVETWPMPTTRVAYPRSVVAYDEQNQEVFRCISLWVLMDINDRAMILPGKSGVEVNGLIRGNELKAPGSLVPKPLANTAQRHVYYSNLDRNGHMNNTFYMDWVADLLDRSYHHSHTPREFTLCYLSEALEGQDIRLQWQLDGSGLLQVNGYREDTSVPGENHRVFSAQVMFEEDNSL